MTLKTYIAGLQEIAEKHPGAIVVYAADDEGNSYSPVHYTGTVGNFKDGEFQSQKNLKDAGDDSPLNAVCIN
jgi:hypothetical protein